VREAEHEYRRLLYVAMTRAADRLVIAGARGMIRMPDGCWYQLVHDALKRDAVEEPADHGEGTVWRWRKAGLDLPGETAAVPEAPRHDVPEWLRRNAPAQARARTISPSAAPGAAIGDPRALARGRILHRLLQALPGLPAERRAEAAQQHVSRIRELSAGERDTIVREVLGLLDDARFSGLFAEGSRAEVPIAGVLDGAHVSGQVDRLAITATEVLIADYKSDRAVPHADDIPQAYIGQLALYRAVLRLLYPNHYVRAALIFTAGPVLTELAETALDNAMSRLTGA
jgi:ATP-dependent helicase/nuclease subunit A